MRIGEVAGQADVNIETLRYYERRGLLREPERSPSSGYRSYPADAVRVVRFIKRAQRLGFRLSEIEMLLDMAGGGPDDCDLVCSLAEEKITDLDAKIEDLRTIRDSLKRLAQTCERPRSERECPILHEIRDE